MDVFLRVFNNLIWWGLRGATPRLARCTVGSRFQTTRPRMKWCARRALFDSFSKLEMCVNEHVVRIDTSLDKGRVGTDCKYKCPQYSSSFFAFPLEVMISRPCRTSYQSSPSSTIPCFPLDLLHVFRHPFCDVAVWRLWSATPSLVIHFPLDHTLHQLASAVSVCVSNDGEFAPYNKS